MLDSRTYLERNITAEQAVRNFEMKKDLKEMNLISLKPLAFTVAAILFIVYILTSGIMSLPKQKLNNVIDNYNDEVIVEMNSLAGGTIK